MGMPQSDKVFVQLIAPGLARSPEFFRFLSALFQVHFVLRF
jgi:hypothetical protein